ncbi:leucine-rich repeat-containing protein 37A2 isoform X2 [Dromaius novaehollandiae]|uniref:leucine-rich repeat-containing protein 37A2 isoform X2 n=1 Tax=Dromaius novaehollandiae TaxID=8790 RepID=UPI00311F9AB9
MMCQSFLCRDFTGNTISSIDAPVWREYLWAEYLVLQDNALKTVGRRSLEGLPLLKHLDLSCNKILSIEEHAFEPLPFLQLINLGGNLITQIRNGTFQAWHGMQFLQKLILSHNPLSVIDDTSFFGLPSVKYLDLGATQVTLQTFHTLLLTTVHLETLKLPSDLACCLCQKKDTIETLCKTIKLRCENLCTTDAPQCAHTDSLAKMQAEIMKVLQSRKLNTTMVLNLKPKEPSLGGHETITLAVNLTSTDADLSKPNDHNSRRNSHFPQHLSGQEGKSNKELMLMLHSIQHMGWTSESDMKKLYFLAKVLVAELEKKLHKAKNVTTVKNIISLPPMLAMHRREVHGTPAVERERTTAATGWVQKQHDLGLHHAPLSLWEAAERLNPTDTVFRHHKMSMPSSKHSLLYSPAEASHLSRSFKIQNYPGTMEQAEETHEMEDVEDGKKAPPPSHSYVWTYKKHGQQESPCLSKSNRLFYRTDQEENPEEEPTPIKSKPEQRLNTAGHFFYNLLVNSSHRVARSVPEDTSKDEASSPGGHSLGIHQTDQTDWKQQKEEGSDFLNEPSSSESPATAPVQGDLFETKLKYHLRLLVPDRALRTFIAHMARALRTDCSLPAVQPACAKMVSKTGLLMKVLSERQDRRGASALAGRCFLGGSVPNGTAQPRAAGRKLAEKKKPEYAYSSSLLVAVSVAAVVVLLLTGICVIEVCSQKPKAASQAQTTSKSRPRWFFQKFLPDRWSKNTPDLPKEGSRASELSKNKPLWLRDMYQPLDSQHKKSMAQKLYDEESSEEEEIFNKAELKKQAELPGREALN